MKILLVSNAIYGGAGKACYRLYDALQARGVDARLLYLDGRPAHDTNVVAFYRKARSLFLRQLVWYPWSRLRSSLLGDSAGIYKLPYTVHRMEEHRLVQWADLVNLHWVPDFIDYKRFFRRVGRKPVIWTLHDMLPFSGGYHWESDVDHRNAKVEARIREVKRQAVRDAYVRIVAPSQWLLGVSQQQKTFQDRPHSRIFNGLPLSVYKPIDKARACEMFNITSHKKILLFTADNVASKRKGVAYLLAALKHLDCSQLALVSVGRGRLDIGLAVEYHHIGRLADEISMAIAYSCADLVIVPSLMDNSPNIIIESFACGRPVVAFGVGGIAELLCSNRLGVLVRDASPIALASAIRHALSESYCTEFIRQHAEAHFGLDSLAGNYQTLYQNALG